ncbi:hypothetical protein HOP62_10345 [Halomonas sp. MCCC 1A17488]|uniref:Uncharacterized protein n=1 Tax=Billgrantia sulfidoxydans TaxID=2733484 RepID=A0ABX7W0E0_9GAMM|nr:MULTISPECIES: hypothetical protein [Halomonas]MCE8016467.1 hypothetical protein [Halomonas sp. MCCC 1A17488]MCG3239800.1 hypothetical protein [Halomonas sp. MCCC 1A17488]QPP50299.1 hypothetical protein I4484_04030 [Halomonas sp. SS10-MC5]QTP53918.1 hypothetical protein HNO51_03985 [Halomonas sulfidoxydans]
MAIFKVKEKKENGDVPGAGGAGGGGIDVQELKNVFDQAAKKSMEVSKVKTEGNTEVDTARAARPNN